jgi:hypothetical protein
MELYMFLILLNDLTESRTNDDEPIIEQSMGARNIVGI